MKKTLYLTLVVGVVVGTWLYGGEIAKYFDNTIDVSNPVRPEPEVKVERVNELDARIEEALAEALPGIEAEAQAMLEEAEAEAKAAYEAALAAAASTSEKYIADETTKVQDSVKENYIAEIEETITSAEY